MPCLPQAGGRRARWRRGRPAASAAARRRRVRGTAPRSYLELHRAADRAPREVAAFHVLRVKALLPQRDGGLAADVKAVDAVHDDGLALRELPGPLLHALRI